MQNQHKTLQIGTMAQSSPVQEAIMMTFKEFLAERNKTWTKNLVTLCNNTIIKRFIGHVRIL